MSSSSPRVKVKLKPKPFLERIARSNISLQEFAKKIGISGAMLTQMLSSYRYPGPIMRKKIQRYARCSWDEIFEIVDTNGGDK
jgi:transcriptional regulator with XRE-family HTH domain